MSRIVNYLALIIGLICVAEDCCSHRDGGEHRMATAIQSIFLGDENFDSKDQSPYLEVSDANIQVLDKISGKVLHKRFKVGDAAVFGTIKITVVKVRSSPPDEEREIIALLKIEEDNKVVFFDWIFASSPSINLFEHQVYDVRVEFNTYEAD
ncbi:MAG: DUF2155 domain-containing protein [Alphaproteobacteria bacterium]|nr:DUF2155 domain-containing protein [Alphaproteobacteria bacterium]